MATAYECDHCKLTFIGEAKSSSDLVIIGTPFTVRFSFGMKRTEEEQSDILTQVQEMKGSPLAQLLGGIGKVNTDAVENTAADLCDPCRHLLLKQALELLELGVAE